MSTFSGACVKVWTNWKLKQDWQELPSLHSCIKASHSVDGGDGGRDDGEGGGGEGGVGEGGGGEGGVGEGGEGIPVTRMSSVFCVVG